MKDLLITIAERLFGKLWPTIEPALTDLLKTLATRFVDSLKGGTAPPTALASVERIATAVADHVAEKVTGNAGN